MLSSNLVTANGNSLRRQQDNVTFKKFLVSNKTFNSLRAEVFGHVIGKPNRIGQLKSRYRGFTIDPESNAGVRQNLDRVDLKGRHGVRHVQITLNLTFLENVAAATF